MEMEEKLEPSTVRGTEDGPEPVEADDNLKAGWK